MSTTPLRFRKSSFSDSNGGVCVELAGTLDAVRDSKNPGTTLVVNLRDLLTAVKSDQHDRRSIAAPRAFRG